MKKTKWRILLIIEIICILLLLPACFRQEQLIYSFSNDESQEQMVQYKSEQLGLTPGVYQVRVKAQVLAEQSMYVELKSDASYFHAIKGNGVTVFPNQEYVDFEVYVTDSVQNAYVQCDFSNNHSDMLTEITVYQLNWGSRMLLFLMVVFFGVFNWAVRCREHIVSGKITKQQQIVFWSLLGAVMIAYVPYCTDYFSLGDDTVFHFLRIEGLKDSIQNGNLFPVRMQSYVNYDHGSPTPIFYSDLFLYIPALLRVIGFSLMTSYKMFVLVVMIATAVISYICLKRCVQNSYGALLGSVFYVLAPYRLINVYSRGAVGEYIAMIFMPLVCCGMYLLYTQSVDDSKYKQYKWWIVIGMSGILQCHLLSTEMTAFVMLLVCVVFWKKTFRKQTFMELFLAVVWVLIWNCWFWLPMIYMLGVDQYNIWDSYSVSIQQEGTHILGLWQMFPVAGSELGPYKGRPINIGAGLSLLLACYAVLRLGKRRDGSSQNGMSVEGKLLQQKCDVFWVCTVGIVFLSTRYFPWDMLEKIPGIGSFVMSLEFPTRFMALATVTGAVFVAFCFLWIREQKQMFYKLVLSIATTLIIGAAVFHVNSLVENSKVTRIHTAENIGSINMWNREYLLDGSQLEDYYYHKPVVTEGLEYTDYYKQGTTISLTLHNRTNETTYVELPLSAYKGYALEADMASQMPYITEERGAHEDLRIAVPAGYEGSVKVSYQGVWLFHVAEGVSLAGLVFVIFMRVIGWKGRSIIGKHE